VIEKNDYDISAPKDEILELIYYNSEVSSRVLFMLGYTFSIQTISKSIQSFSKCELLKTQKNLNLEWTPNPKEIEQEIIEIPNQDKAEYKTEDFLIQVNNLSENEKAIEIELSVEKKKDKTIIPDNEIIDKVKEHKVKITKNIEITKHDNKVTTAVTEPSITLGIYESNLNNENTDKTDLTLFTDDDNSIEKNENFTDDEVTKSVPELLNWIHSHKSISKSALSEWKRFIEKYLKYGNHSLLNIFNKVKTEKLEKKLTLNMLDELEKFFTQQ
jgi:ligand-binding SRPBCC domain-containing protein